MSNNFHNSNLVAIEEKLGRPLRVLHIGNIANNAYNNARIQRQYGIEAEVLCYDYYHIMACPEWEDETFIGEVDQNWPDWWSTNLMGWKRPKWFAQGPLGNCILYLLARRFGFYTLSDLLWSFIESKSHERTKMELSKISNSASHKFKQINIPFNKIVNNIGLSTLPLPNISFHDLEQIPDEELSNLSERLFDSKNILVKIGPSGFFSNVLSKCSHFFSGHHYSETTMNILKQQANKIILHLSHISNNIRYDEIKKRIHYVKSYKLSETLHDLQLIDLMHFDYQNSIGFRALFKEYDIVQCYSTDGFIPWFIGDRYVCYEHGTLRDLPFNKDYYGVITNISYKSSDFTFITNSDVQPATERMGLDPKRVIRLPHAFDDRKLIKFREQNLSFVPPPGPPIIFSPTRQHWKDGNGSWTKGNDILFRAAEQVAREGYDFRLHLVAWGQEIEESKALIAELGLTDKVVWKPTMQKRELWEAYCKAHAVADQFMLPALGGIGFETMALGRRLITAIDVHQLTQFFGEAPPCLAASTIEQCAAQLRHVVMDPEDKAGLGLAAEKWIRDYHSSERIVSIQSATYAEFLGCVSN